MRIINKIKPDSTPHYLIIGHYTGKVIGCCCGKRGKRDVLAEEPLSTFKRVSRRKCPICKEYKQWKAEKGKNADEKENMERLTSYKNKCKREMICRYEDCDTSEEYCLHLNEDNCPCLQEILEKLAEYEDLEEQGKLLKLSCAVGDTVYFIKANFSYMNEPKAEKIRKIELLLNDIVFRTESRSFGIENINKTVFLTKEEAEAALKKMQEGGK